MKQTLAVEYLENCKKILPLLILAYYCQNANIMVLKLFQISDLDLANLISNNRCPLSSFILAATRVITLTVKAEGFEGFSNISKINFNSL